jgi:hypothetical protein
MSSVHDTVEPDLDGASVDALQQTHRTEIDRLRTLVPELPKPSQTYPFHDDIFLLRYVLSFSTAAKAAGPLRETLAWRKEPAVASMLEKCADGGKAWMETPLMQTMAKYQVAGVHDCKRDGSPFVIIRPGLGNQDKLFDSMTYDEMHMAHFAYREIAMRSCDEITRRTRVVAKQTLVFDMSGLRFALMMDRRGQKVHQPVSKASSNYFPQLQSKFVMMNAPTWISVVMNLMTKIMPKRNMEKMALCPCKNTSKGDMRKCPFASKHLLPEKTPRLIGGQLADDDASIHPSLTGALLAQDGEDGGGAQWVTVTVPRQAQVERVVEVPMPGARVLWSLKLADRGIRYSAELLRVGGHFS